jgi:hypothetical protein
LHQRFYKDKNIKASDIYNFGIIMWEFNGRKKTFWDRNHDTELIVEICDGLCAPEGYIDLMKKCRHSDPEKKQKKQMKYLKNLRKCIVSNDKRKLKL